jgi:hypothetical protein
MWLATQYGFYSIVKKAEDTYFVRARVRQDLVNLVNLLDLETEVHEWDQADYRYRIVVNAQRLIVIMTKLATTLDYPNFKGRIGELEDQRNKLGSYHKIWSAMADLQRE